MLGIKKYLDVKFALQKLRQQEASTSHQYEHGDADADESLGALFSGHVTFIRIGKPARMPKLNDRHTRCIV